MYKEKLKEQLAELEKLQKNCAVERPEVSLAVSERILELAAVMDACGVNAAEVEDEPSTAKILDSMNEVITKCLEEITEESSKKPALANWHNTFSVRDGKGKVNGAEVKCVTNFSIECVTGTDYASVTLVFDVPKNAIEPSVSCRGVSTKYCTDRSVT